MTAARSRVARTLTRCALLALCCNFSLFGQTGAPQPYTISTVVGNSIITEGGNAANQPLPNPSSVAVDSSGNVYIVFPARNRIYKVTAAGVITTFAGTVAGFGGDGAPAAQAQLYNPQRVAVDSSGNVYISDSFNRRIRKVTTDGIIRTIAGNGSFGTGGESIAATSSPMRSPMGLALDSAGNVYFADSSDNKVRKITTAGLISTVAGTGASGYGGDGGAATSAQLANPLGVAIDGSGNLLITDNGNNRIRKVATSGVITTIAGNGTRGFAGDNGPATSAQLACPNGITLDASGNIFFTDECNQAVRKIATNGTITTSAGVGGQWGFGGDGGPATAAKLRGPWSVAFDASGIFYIADTFNGRVRKVATNGTITTFAGTAYSATGDGGPATSAQVMTPWAMTTDASGNLYIADRNEPRIRKVATNGTITTIAGNGTFGSGGDNGPATSAQLSNPGGVAVDSSGNVFIADTGNNRIRKIATNGTITTIAGTGASGFSGDGSAATSALLAAPEGIAVDSAGIIYVADTGNYRIRKIATNGTITTIAGTGGYGFGGDGGPALSALFQYPKGLALDASGNLYVADRDGNRIRKIATNGTIVSINSNNGGHAVTADPSGNIYYSTFYNVYKVQSDGTSVNIGGTGRFDFGGDGAAALSAGLIAQGIAANSAGDVFICDYENYVVRKLSPVPAGSTVVRVSPATIYLYGSGGTTTVSAFLSIFLDGPGTYTWSASKSVATPNGATWLSLGSSSGTGTSTITANGNPVGLSAGAYQGSVTISSPSAANTLTVPVVFIVPPPTLSVSPSNINASGGVGGSNPPSQPITISNSGAGTLNLFASATINTPSGGNWLSYSLNSSTAPGSITVNFNTAGLAAGAYTGSITVSSPDAINTPVTVPVTLTLATLPAAIGVDRNSLYFTANGSQNIGISNAGGGALSWSAAAASTGNWLTISPNSGGVGTLSATANAGSLANGTYRGTITITAAGAVNSPVIVPLLLRVGPEPTANGPYTSSVVAGLLGVTEGGAASDQPLGRSLSVAADSGGNVYIAVPDRNKIFKVSVAGTIMTVAGNGQPGSSGDGGPATAAQLNNPNGVAVDETGNVFIADSFNNRIRKISSDGIIRTVVGTGGYGFSGDGGPAISVTLASPRRVAVDSAGNLYIADQSNYRIRKVGTDGRISTIAGNGSYGYSGDGGAATAAQFSSLMDVAVDAARNVYVADTNNYRVRRIGTDGIITTVAGSGSSCCTPGDGGSATSAQVTPQGIALDAAGNLFIADSNNRIRKVSSAGVITTVAGDGNWNFGGDGGPATSAQIRSPNGVALDSSGNIYIADGNNRIRKVTSSNGAIQTIAGITPGFGGDGGPATSGRLAAPSSAVMDLSGNTYIADQYNHRIRKIATDGQISTIAGSGTAGFSGDGGSAVNAQLSYPRGVAVDTKGNIYVADSSNNRVRKIAMPGGTITTIAGSGGYGSLGDGGPAISASITSPQAVAVDTTGNVFIGDSNRVRKVTLDGNINTVAGIGVNPTGLAVDGSGNLYIASFSGNLRKVAPDGTISTLATSSYWGIGTDFAGNVYASAYGNITKYPLGSSTGTNIAGNGNGGLFDPAGLNTRLIAVSVSSDPEGNLLLADDQQHVVRKLTLAAPGSQVLRTSPVSVYLNTTSPSIGSSLSILFDGQTVTGLTGSGAFSWTATSTVTTPSGGSWLSLGSTSGTSGTSLSFTATRGSLSPGSYLGSITVTSPSAVNSVTVPVEFTVPPPTLSISASSITASGGAGGSNPPSQTMTITNSGTGTLNLTRSVTVNSPAGGSWLSATLSSTDAPSTLTAGFNTAGLTAGTYTGTITVASDGAVNSPVTIPVTLTMANLPPAIGVDRNSLYFTAAGSQSIGISNVGGGTLNWSASAASTGNWLTISPSSGTGAGAISAAANAGSLATGTYRGTITITATGAANSPVIVPLLLRIGPEPTTNGPYMSSTIAGVLAITEGGSATNQPLARFMGVAADSAGNTYIAAPARNKVFKVNAAGAITTIAGTGISGSNGDGGPATLAQLNNPNGVAVDAAGNVFIADSFNNRIRKISSDGIIRTIAGTGSSGFSGDGGPAIGASLNNPYRVALDAAGNIYIADRSNNRIRKVGNDGRISTIAGTGSTCCTLGDGGPATSAQLSSYDAAIDASGNVYIADTNNNRIRRVGTDGIITTIAGTGSTCCTLGDGGPATSGQLSSPQGIGIDASGNLYVADSNNSRIRKIATNGTITTVAGDGSSGFGGDGGTATSAQMRYPSSVAVDSAGNIYIGDSDNLRVRKVTANDNVIRTIAGTTPGYGGDGSAATSARLAAPVSTAIDLSGNIYVADQWNHRIRKIDANGQISTIAGSGTAGFSGDGGSAVNAQLSYPRGVAVDAKGNIYVADSSNNRVRKITMPGGTITTIAGSGGYGSVGDGGQATAASIASPRAIAVDTTGNVFIGDSTRVRKVTLDGNISTVAGTDVNGSSGDGGPATAAQIQQPYGLTLDGSGNLYIANPFFDNRIRKVTPDGTISTFATSGAWGVSTDFAGSVYASTYGNINKFLTGASISNTVAGGGNMGLADGPALSVRLNAVSVASDPEGNLILADDQQHVIRKLTLIPAGSQVLRTSPAAVYLTTSGTSVTSNVSIFFDGQTVTGVAGSGAFSWTATPSVTTPPGGSWLSLGSTSGTSGTSLSFTATRGSLSPGSYLGSITITSPSAVNSVSVPVEFIVPPPTISISLFSISASGGVGGSNPPSQTMTITNSGTGPLNLTTSVTVNSPAGGSWLSATLSSTNAPSTLTAGFNTAGLTAGTYTGTITVASDGAVNSPVTIPVTLTLANLPPAAGVDRNSLYFTANGSQSIGISNIGGGSMNWSAAATSTGNWLTISPNSGAGAGTISATANAGSLANGTYRGTITITSTGAVNSPVIVPLLLRIGPEPTTNGPYISSTIAGVLAITEGGSATAQPLGRFIGVAADSSGNAYIAVPARNKVFKIGAAGNLTTVAGNGQPGSGGDGGPAILAQLNNPQGVALDASGNLYIADFGNNRVRKISSDGVIRTIAGTGSFGFSGDGGPATGASLNPYRVALDAAGNIYIADRSNNRIRKVGSDGRISTIAGTGSTCCTLGDGGPATSAQLNFPYDVAVDASSNVYILDTSNNRVRRIGTDGIITTIAGTGSNCCTPGDGGPATSAQLNSPQGIGIDASGNLYIADSGNSRIRKISTNGTITTVAGDGNWGFGGDGGAATSAQMRYPSSVAVDSSGNIYIGDGDNLRVRKVSANDNVIRTIAGTAPGYGGDGAAATNARLAAPNSTAIDLAGNIYVTDQWNHRIRKISPSGQISTVAGTGVAGFSGDGGAATGAQLSSPRGVAVDTKGDLYIADSSNNRVRKVVMSGGTITTIAGSGGIGSLGDGGAATLASLTSPQAIAVDTTGNVFVSDQYRVRKITLDGNINTVAGTGINGTSGDGGPATTAQIRTPMGLAIDGNGNLYIASANFGTRIRKVAPDGTITTLANSSGWGVGTDLAGNVYASTLGSINKFLAGASTSTTVAGSGNMGLADGPALSTQLIAVSVTSDPEGNLIFADDQQHVVRKLTLVAPGSQILRVSPATSFLTSAATSVSGSTSIIFDGQTVTGFSGSGAFSWTATSSVTTPTGGNWLSLNSTSGTSGTSLSFTANRGSLGAGAYQGNITISSPSAINGSVTLPVVYIVPPPTMSLSPLSLQQRAGVGAANPPSQVIQVNNTGIGFFTYTAARTILSPNGGNWLSVSPASGGSGGLLTLSYNTTGLAEGTYSAQVTIASTDAFNSSAVIPVTLTMVTGAPIINLDRTRISLNATGSSAVSQTVAISNIGSGTLSWTTTAVSAGNWLSVSPASGTGAGTLTITATPGSLATGNYAGTVTIAASGALNAPVVIPVAFRAGPAVTGPYAISTVAGPITITNGGAATAQPLPRLTGIAVDNAGNTYVAGDSRGQIYKITSAGVLTVYAGTGVPGRGGDGGPATSAQMMFPQNLTLDAGGSLYVADSTSQQIRKITTDGIITTVAGITQDTLSGLSGFSGDGGPATQARLNGPRGVAFDAAGNMFIADSINNRVRKVSADGTITTFAGTGTAGFSGDGGPATAAQLNSPYAVLVDSSGNVLIADRSNRRVRKVATDGTISTIAGNGSSPSGTAGDGGAATSAQISLPSHLSMDSAGNLYITDTGNSKVRKVSASGIITTVAGTGSSSFSGDGGAATSATLRSPFAAAVDAAGNLYISDGSNNRVRKVTAADGNLQTAAGSGPPGFAGDSGPAAQAQMNGPVFVASDAAGNLYIADNTNQRIRKTLTDGTIVTIAGTGTAGFSGDGGPATSAMISSPIGIAVDSKGNVFFADQSNNRIRRIATDGTITTVVGNGSFGFSGDGGLATSAGILFPRGVAVDAIGNLYFTDQNARIRRVTPDGVINTIAGTGIFGSSGDGGAAVAAQISSVITHIAVDSQSTLYFVDAGRVRKVQPDGTINAVYTAPPSTSTPSTVTVDAAGTVWIGTTSQLSKVVTDSSRQSIAGGGFSSFLFNRLYGDAVPALAASIISPASIAADDLGNYYVLDSTHNLVRKISPMPSGQAAVYTSLANMDFSVCTAIPILQKSLTITLDGTGAFSWSASTLVGKPSGGTWLSLSSSGGTGTTTFSVTANATGLSPGVYSAMLTISTPQALNSTVSVPISLVVSSTCNPAPTLTSINPATVQVGAANTTLTLTGTNFVPGSAAIIAASNGSQQTALATTYASATELSAIVPSFFLSLPQPWSISVSTPAPGGGSSSTQTLNVVGGVPSISNISPPSGNQGATVSAMIAGANLSGATRVDFSGTGITATIATGGTSTSLPVTIAIASDAVPGTRTFTVTTAGGTSLAFTGFTVVEVLQPPLVTGINPSGGSPGATGLSATVSGLYLGGATRVDFSGTGVSATIAQGGTSTSLPIAITITANAPLGLRTFTVTTPAGTSASFSGFAVISGPAPVISDPAAIPPGLSQTIGPYYGGPFTLTIRGQNFVSGAVVSAGSSGLATTFVSSTQLTAVVPTPALSSLGNTNIRVTSPDSQASNTAPLKVVVHGDTNGNGSINIGDALVCALTAGGINRPPLPVSVGDLNLNGNVNIGDCLVGALFAGRVIANFAVPVITSVSPSPAVRGSAITIAGTGFAVSAADNLVLFTTTGNGVTRVVASEASGTSITVAVPNDATSGPIQIYRVDVPLGGAEFALPVSGISTPLALTSVSPYFTVPVGTPVTLTGMGFDPAPANNTVLFKSSTGTVAATVTAASSTSLTVNVPAGAVCGPVTVGTGGQTSNARMVVVAGTSCGVQLADIWGGGIPGETLVLEGAGFDVVTPANNIVKFTAAGGGAVIAPVLAAGGTQLHVRIPAAAVQGNVTVTVGAATSNALNYPAPSPMIPSSVDVVINSANPVGSYQVTITFNKNIVTLDAANVKGGSGAGFTSKPITVNVDNAAGTVRINHFQTGNAPAGQFTVANFTFTPAGVGTTNLTLSGLTLTDTAGGDLPTSRCRSAAPPFRCSRYLEPANRRQKTENLTRRL